MMQVVHPFTKRVVFMHSELACGENDPHHGQGRTPLSVLTRLGIFRSIVRHIMNLSSANRSIIHNDNEDGKEQSFHIYEPSIHPEGGCAWDVKTYGWSEEKKRNFVFHAWSFGYSVGVANSFIHIDDRSYLYGWRQAWWTYKGYRGVDYAPTIFSKIARMIG